MTAPHVVIVGNRTLAARARSVAGREPPGSLGRKAALSAAVLLDETRSVSAARKLLGEIVDDAMRQAAADMLDQLTKE